MKHQEWLTYTVELAVVNVQNGGGPFAAILVKDGEIIGLGVNPPSTVNDPTAHAELLAIQEACAHLQTHDLSDCVLYASGEPCPMCLGASYWATVGQIFYACSKEEAHQAIGFADPLIEFFTDQQLSPEKRSVPFIQNKITDATKPFLVWDQQQSR